MTKKTQTEITREIYQQYLDALKEHETQSELTAEKLAKIKKDYPNVTDEKAVESHARYPVYTKGWPEALFCWVEHQAKNKKKFTDLKRGKLLRLVDDLRVKFEYLDDILNPTDIDILRFTLMGIYLIGAMCPAPDETWEKVAPALKNTTGRTPKWYRVADEVRAELAAKKPSVRGTTPSKTARYELLHTHLSKRLEKLEMKPVSKFSVRDYLTRADRERT
jgi:hypothetical protein